jgi:membrane fusion protein (multidrug efflux system)
MKILSIAVIVLGLFSLSLSGCESVVGSNEISVSEGRGSAGPGSAEHGDESHGEGHHEHKLVVTSPVRKDVISTQKYVCQIHSCQHIEVRALVRGYLEEICVKEGQAVKKGELMFKLLPIVYQAKLDSEDAEVQRIQIALDNAESLAKKGYVSPQEIALKQAELAKAKANLALARAEISFTSVEAPFDGIVDRQLNQLGSLIEEGDILTTCSDNSVMWAYFNVPEKNYLAYKADLDNDQADAGKRSDNNQQAHLEIELKLANHEIFPQKGIIGAIEADFDNTTGNISFRADFPNPDGLLRHGQTGTVLIHSTLKDAIVIPQRATYEILAKQYVYVVDKDNVVHQRDITVQTEQDDIFVIQKGVEEGDKIILEGIRQVRDGDHLEEYGFQAPEEVLSNLKYHAE